MKQPAKKPKTLKEAIETLSEDRMKQTRDKRLNEMKFKADKDRSKQEEEVAAMIYGP